MERLLQDVAYALRSFRRSPGFVAVALLSLTLGIGATTAIFSVIYAVLISPYPYARPHEIWAPAILGADGKSGRGSYAVEEFLQLGELPVFSDVMATGFEGVLLTGEFAPESFQGVRLSPNAFGFLGVPPVTGRTIGPADVRASGEPEPVVVLSHKVWLRLFDGDPAAVGRTLRLNDVPHTIVGVMPARFGWYGSEALWLPLGTIPQPGRMVNPIVRLADGVSPGVAEEQLHALHLRLSQETPAAFPAGGFNSQLRNYLDITVASGEMRTSLYLLLGAVGLLLLIGCANVANLQLTRGTARSREMAVRLSVGAGRGRLTRQLLTENIMLALLGGVLGVLFALGATHVIVALMPEFYVPNEARVTINTPVLMFSLGVSLLTGILFGLIPALQASRADLTHALKEGGREGGAGTAGRRTRSLLVVAEVALSVVLLVGAALTVRTFMSLQGVDLGFAPDRVLMVGVPLPPARYPTLEARNLFAAQLLERVRTLPGVQGVTIGNGGLPFGGPQSTYQVEGRTESEVQRVVLNLIAADYLRTMAVPLRAGRTLEEREVLGGDRVALINEAAARRFWPDGTDPIGRRVRLGVLEGVPDPNVRVDAAGEPLVTVVGVVANTRNSGLRDEPAAVVLIPYTLVAPPQRTLAIRAHGDPRLLLNPIRREVQALDKEQPLSRPITLDEVLGFQTVQPRFTMALFGALGALGLVLAAAGIYGVLTFHVTRRTHEIGVRMALGARPGDILRLMLRMGGELVITGLAVGVVASLFATRLLRSQLFGVSETDPLAYAAVAAVLGLVALLACYLPSRRAAAVEPLVALRHQ